MSVVPDAFGGPPKEKMDVNLRFGIGGWAYTVPLFDGTVVLQNYSRTALDYEIYQPEIKTKFLAEGTDTEGNTVPIPLPVGDVAYMPLQRTGTDTEWRYYRPDFAGVLGTDWHLYDDGVTIDGSWTENGDGTMSRSVSIIGELTASGTGSITDIAGLAEYAADRLGVAFISPHSGDVPVDHAFSADAYLIDVLGKVAWYCGYYYYFDEDPGTKERQLVLISADDQHGESDVTEFEYEYCRYTWPDRIKSYAAEVATRVADSSQSNGIREDVSNLLEYGQFPMVGAELTLSDVYSSDSDRVRTQLLWHLSYFEKPFVEIRMPLEYKPRHGEKITFRDTTKPGVIVNSGTFYISEISLSPKESKMTIGGRGDVLFEAT
jgi:hypothetical protein